MAFLEVKGLKKTYKARLQANKVEALRNISFSVEKGEFVAIMGESGSGKTTLLNILAMFDKPTEGEVFLEGKNMSAITEKEISKFRRNHLGYVFQDFNLLDTFHVEDNILLPLVLAGVSYNDMMSKLAAVIDKLKIRDLMKKFPYEISGGQKQRTAIGRALITEPDLIFADEPTGALDSNAADQLMEYFEEIHRGGQTILMVTHSSKAAAYASRVLFIRDGKIFHQIYKAERSNREMYEEILKAMTMLAG